MSIIAEKPLVTTLGASIEAIQQHYDLSNDFYALWLDETMTYSCALWESGDTLEQAQIRKLDYHLEQARARNANRFLEIGSGWGSLLAHAVKRFDVRFAQGLTLSQAQHDYVRERYPQDADPRIRVDVDSWEDHHPEQPYDAIVSLGAMEHFSHPRDSAAEKVAKYRRFFERCHDMLNPGGFMSLQTITFGSGEFGPSAVADIFPESHLPRLGEIIEASARTFELVRLRNDRRDYARTSREWLKRLSARRELAAELVGEETVHDYRKYLAAGGWAHTKGVFYLYRLTLQRLA